MCLLNKNNNKALLFPNARLPILQGGTFTLLSPTMALLSMPEWTCPAWTQNASLVNTSSPEFINVWQSRMHMVRISATDSLCKDSWTYVEWFEIHFDTYTTLKNVAVIAIDNAQPK